jgi:hypothetical protein
MINWLTLFKELITVYTENHIQPINTNAVLLLVQADGTYIYLPLGFKGLMAIVVFW